LLLHYVSLQNNPAAEADSLQDSFVALQQSCEDLSAAAAGLQELRLTVQQLEQDATEVVLLQQRKEELASVPQELLQLRQEVDELQQMAEEQQAMQVCFCWVGLGGWLTAPVHRKGYSRCILS
jgi:uncharacterized phage infection (PIP) family protein YhgE